MKKRSDKTELTGESAVETDSRRDALKKMALYSAYATPALLALMHSNKAHAAGSVTPV